MSGTQDPNDPSPTPPPHNEPPVSPPPHAQPEASGANGEERQWGMFAHLASLAGLIIPFGSIIGPLVVWLIKKDTMAFVDDQGKEALNFNITVGIVAVALLVLTFITFGIGAILTAPAGVLVFLAWLVLTIIAAIKANEGQNYRYPFTLRLVK